MHGWVSAWSYRTLDFRLFQTLVGDETQRVMLKNNVNGSRVRLRFSNEYGVEPLCFEGITLGISRDMITSEVNQSVAVTFGGKRELMLEANAQAVSDEIPFEIHAGENLCVTTYMAQKCLITSGCTCYPQPISRVYNSPSGDFRKDAYFPVRPQGEYFRPVKDEPEVSFIYGLNRVDVFSCEDVKTITCFGDSITHQSKWTGAFADRIYRAYPGKCTLLNCGIGGNRILHDAYALSSYGGLFGAAGIKRFEQDVFGADTPVDLVIVLEGVNDLLHPTAHYAPASQTVTDKALIEGLSQYAAICRARHTPIFACTLMPFYNFINCWDVSMEDKRQCVNAWIRTSGAFDGYLDFDLFVRDPQDHKRICAAYDSGDNIHPSQGGGIHIAYSINPAALIKAVTAH
ncbi:MAG: GDSL-type esterase/lipase family protein [Clostridia bacterium]